MILIAGLGNPDLKYAATRHNVGFEAVACLLEAYHIKGEKKKFHALLAQGDIEGIPCLFCRPQTYMNNSGVAVREIMDFYKISVSDLIVIYDDISIPLGALRLRGGGSAGGHNGMKSIIAHVGSQDFPRVRIGVGEKPPGWDLADYVLSNFSKDEIPVIGETIRQAAQAAACIVSQGLDRAMNRFNLKAPQGGHDGSKRDI